MSLQGNDSAAVERSVLLTDDALRRFQQARFLRRMREAGLDGRTQEALQRYIQGESDREIAQALGFSEPTVRRLFAQAMHAVGGRNRAHAALIYWGVVKRPARASAAGGEHGIIETDENAV